MKFRPCIDIHNGQVKQIVGSSLTDQQDRAEENYISEKDAAWYAKLYQKQHLDGGHIILLNPLESPYYEADVHQAKGALSQWPGGLQIGGGMNLDNSKKFLNDGASHIIVTSYVFKDGQIHLDRLKKLCASIGRQHLVLDLSCRKKPTSEIDHSGQAPYYIVTDRWQKYTDVVLNEETLSFLSPYCDEFLIHAVDVEGKNSGIENELVKVLGNISERPITYAGGIHSLSDIDTIRKLGHGNIDFTVGSALDLFGGSLPFEDLCRI